MGGAGSAQAYSNVSSVLLVKIIYSNRTTTNFLLLMNQL